MAKGKKEVSVDAPDKSPRGLKSPRAGIGWLLRNLICRAT